MPAVKFCSKICLLLLLSMALSCGDDDGPVGTMPGPDTKAPTVVSVTPADGATNVTTNASIVVTFSENVDGGTTGLTSFFLTPDPGCLCITDVSGNVVTLTTQPLAAGTDYMVTVTTAVTDEAGNNLATQFTSTFTTAGGGTGTPQFVLKWGVIGSNDGEFFAPAGVAVDQAGDVYVAGFINNRVQKFNSTGTFVRKWGMAGTGNGQFDFPVGVAVDGGGNSYVVEQSGQRVQKFDGASAYALQWGSPCDLGDPIACVDPDGAGPLELGDGEFDFPVGVAVDVSGNVYVVDQGNDRVRSLTARGRLSRNGARLARRTVSSISPAASRWMATAMST